MHKTLLPPKPQASKFYLLPKLHKEFEGFPKCRPIVASSGCNTERISWWSDQQVKDKVKKLDSYIEDTPDLLRQFLDINEKDDIPEDTIPISIDISMYSNIPLEEGLAAFRECLEERRPCYNPQYNSCNFLDLKISIKDRVIRTDLYRKPTDKPRALLPSSAHPNHIPTNIIYSMAFRLLRICDEENIFEERLAELKNNFLLPRSYKSRIIENQFKRVKELPGENYAQRRKLALQKKIRNQDPQTKKRVKAVFDFNPLLPKISTVLKKHHRTMLSDNPELKDSFPDPPMACLRQGPNLRRLLCKSSLIKATRPARATHRSAAGWKRCSHTSGRQCAKCPFTPPTASSVTSHITGYTHHITTPIT